MEALTAAEEKLQAIKKAARKRTRDFEGLREQLGHIRAIVHSPDGSVAVAAGPGGTVQDIRFSPQALALGPDGLRAAVMGTLRQAVAEAARQQAQVTQQVVGDDLDVVGRVRATQAQPVRQGPVIPPPAPPAPAAAAPKPPRPTRPRPPVEEEPAEYQVNMVRKPRGHR